MRSLQTLPFVILACATGQAWAQPTFTPLGLPPQTQDAVAYAISDDGSVVVGVIDALNTNQAYGGWVWRRGAGYRYLPEPTAPMGDSGAGAFAVSGNGSRIVGVANDFYNGTMFAASWTPTGPLTVLGDLPGGDDLGAAFGISRDGTVVVGTGSSDLAGSEAFLRGPDGVMTGLGFLPGQDWSEAYAANADGTVVVGMAYDSLLQFSAMYWTAEVGMLDLGRSSDAFGAYAYAVSDDGTVVVGENLVYDEVQDNIYTHGFRWTASDWMVELGPLPPEFIGSSGYCVSGDGALVGGTLVNLFNQTTAMVWDAPHGCRSLGAILTDAGLGQAIQGWTLLEVSGVSADGTYLVGNGYAPSGALAPFVVHLPGLSGFCPADFNKDGFVDGIDYDLFNIAFENPDLAQQMAADFNKDGFVDGIDYDQFNFAFETGGC